MDVCRLNWDIRRRKLALRWWNQTPVKGSRHTADNSNNDLTVEQCSISKYQKTIPTHTSLNSQCKYKEGGRCSWIYDHELHFITKCAQTSQPWLAVHLTSFPRSKSHEWHCVMLHLKEPFIENYILKKTCILPRTGKEPAREGKGGDEWC